MSGKLNNYRGSGATALNTLSTWSCTQHDSTDTLSGYGTVLVLKNIDPLGSTTQSWTDGAGRTFRSIDQAGNATVMTYDAGGNQLSVRDANNVGADMLYDALGRNTQRTDTAAAVTKTEYDKSGNAIKQTDAKNKHTFISFDSRNRRKSTTDRINAATNFAYTALGQLASLTDAQNQTTSYIYDSRGSKLTETYPDHTPSTSPGQTGYGIVTFTYDNAGRRLTSDVLGNGITESCTYSNDNLLTAINYSNASLGNLTYTWDTNKNKKSESIGGVMSGYGFTNAGTTYDDEDRLTGYQRTNGALSQSWNLTSVGDWNSVTTSGIGFQPVVQNRTHGPTHELLTAGGQTVNTDVKGNITLLPAVLASSLSPQASSLQWDFDNKLKSVDVGNNSSTDVEYKYDALGRRVARVGSSGSFVYVQSDQQTIADYGVGDAPSSPLYRYVYASYIDEPVVRKGAGTGGTVHYYHRNQQYSITAITSSAGSIAERYAYNAYGEPSILDGSGSVIANSAINNRYSYTGREWDATVGLYHFRARWMSPKSGRFITRDPIGYRSGSNLFRFVRNAAIVYVDPLGLFEVPTAGSISAAQLNYAFWNCISACACSVKNAAVGAEIVCERGCGYISGSGMSSSTEQSLMDEMHRIYQAGNTYATQVLNSLNVLATERDHSALRHCYSSGLYAKLLGCGCASCLGHYREQYQLVHDGQSPVTTNRTDFNNSMGRHCAGCVGQGNSSDPSIIGFGLLRLPYNPDHQIRQCCKEAFSDNRLWLGTTQPPNSETVPWLIPFPCPDCVIDTSLGTDFTGMW